MSFLLIFGLAQGAEAGIFSVFQNLFKNEKQNRPIGVSNSQTALLLDGSSSGRINFAGTGGGDIVIEEDGVLASSAGALLQEKDTEENNQISLYVVREGDTLSEIAKLFKISVNTIFWANNLTRKDQIRTSQVLVILPISGVKYEVKKGDTIEKVAKNFHGNIEEIIGFNGLPADGSLTPGETIIIPDGEFAIAEAPISGSALSAGGTADYSGYYLRPIIGGRKSQGLHGLNGVDLATFCDEPVYASASGDVIIARSSGWNSGYGKYLVINHPNGTQTLYAHLNSIIVSSGWHVTKGQIIGYIGSTGKSTGCHIHFEVRGAKNPF